MRRYVPGSDSSEGESRGGVVGKRLRNGHGNRRRHRDVFRVPALIGARADDVAMGADALFALQAELTVATEGPGRHRHPLPDGDALDGLTGLYDFAGDFRARNVRRFDARTRANAQPDVEMVDARCVNFDQDFIWPRFNQLHGIELQCFRPSERMKAYGAHRRFSPYDVHLWLLLMWLVSGCPIPCPAHMVPRAQDVRISPAKRVHLKES